NQGIDPLEWWHSFLVRWEHNPNFIDQIFNKKWSKFHEMWNNDWMDWWSAEWQSNAWFSWNPVTILAFDDDLATSILTVRMHSDQGIPTIYNLSPQVSIQSPGTTIVEDALAVFEAPTIDYYNTSIVTNPELLHFTWDFGDGTITSASSTMNHTWSTAGEYLVQVLVSDGEYTGTALLLVNVVNTLPQVITVSGPQNMTEDYIARFSVENNTIDSASDMGSLRFIWDFADGTFATGKTVEHAWAIDGFYNITVYAIDNNGAVTSKIHPIVVCEVNPCIKGPYNIQVFEGNFISYNMSFEDTILDQQALAFTWNIDGVNYSSPRLQTLLGVGYHSGTLTLTDADGNTDVDDILIYVDNVIPSVSIQNRVLYGPSMPVILTAYAMDDIRGMGDLVFNWTLNGTYTPIDTTMVDDGCVSVVTWEPGHSGNYEARVSVTDATGATVESQFIIYVTLDTDLDGVPDELEASFGLGSSGPDSDGDMLCDAYEINYTRTDPADFDTDDDLLWDGINPAVGTGEAYLGTDPRKNDTDGDGLLDGIEVFGWNISVQFLNGTIDNRTVTSDPLVIDTDKDRLTDYQEFLNHTDPRSADTDKDGKSDFLESEYANLVDTDNDGVSDIKETETGLIVRFSNGTSIRVFSNATNNDTDGDGLKDYEEWYPAGDGFITNPANNDTDGDGILDLAEGFTKVQEYGIRKKIVAGTTGYFYFYANFGSNLKNITVTFGATTAADKSADFHAIVKFQNQLVIDNSSAGSTYYFNASD
ncbi:MAG: PKD domain-containing protein, partial [Candidatus Lokiarchaeota archaeon]|nr:PKD domain-containing protein [Candidatus Lokiarchaeota archaeon]